MSLLHRLRYVCKYCGALIASYPEVATDEAATLSVCGRAECRAEAAAEYRGNR